MKLFFKVIGLLAALFALFIFADRCFRFSRDYTRRYIDVFHYDGHNNQ